VRHWGPPCKVLHAFVVANQYLIPTLGSKSPFRGSCRRAQDGRRRVSQLIFSDTTDSLRSTERVGAFSSRMRQLWLHSGRTAQIAAEGSATLPVWPAAARPYVRHVTTPARAQTRKRSSAIAHKTSQPRTPARTACLAGPGDARAPPGTPSREGRPVRRRACALTSPAARPWREPRGCQAGEVPPDAVACPRGGSHACRAREAPVCRFSRDRPGVPERAGANEGGCSSTYGSA
jgi:hypothetical protein